MADIKSAYFKLLTFLFLYFTTAHLASKRLLFQTRNQLSRISITKPQLATSIETLSEPKNGFRAQKLKDLAFLKEVKNNLLAAELALQVDLGKPGSKKGSINFEGLAGKLEKDLEVLERRARSINLFTSNEDVDNLIAQLIRYQQDLEQASLKVKQQSDFSASIPVGEKKDSAEGILGISVNPLTYFVREDGTVDVELLVESGKEAAVFGSELWKRINGRQPDGEEGSKKLVKLPDSEKVIGMEEQLLSLEQQLAEAQWNEDNLKQSYRALKKEGAAITREMRVQLRAAEDVTLELVRLMKILSIDIELERLFPYIEQEIEQSPVASNDQKTTIAEYTLIEQQLKSLLQAARDRDTDFLLEQVDDSELEVIRAEVEDIKMRLGLDLLGRDALPMTIKFDAVAMQLYLEKTFQVVQQGFSFYVEGSRILTSDVQYAIWLIARAVQGYTLAPREVRVIRRTGKDLLTFIPFIIILLIPLSPVGHVLVFSFIQRFFPDFFPSPYTDRRQNLMKMYEAIEDKDIEQL